MRGDRSILCMNGPKAGVDTNTCRMAEDALANATFPDKATREVASKFRDDVCPSIVNWTASGTWGTSIFEYHKLSFHMKAGQATPTTAGGRSDFEGSVEVWAQELMADHRTPTWTLRKYDFFPGQRGAES